MKRVVRWAWESPFIYSVAMVGSQERVDINGNELVICGQAGPGWARLVCDA